MDATVELDHHPEIVEGGKGTRRLELLGIREELREPQRRRKFFTTLTNNEFQKMIGYINSISRGQPIEYDYADGQMHSTPTPALEDRERLMNLTFDTVRQINSNPDLDDVTALRLAGLAFAGAINYIHPYLNGNGRTARIMHYLIEFGSERETVLDDELYAIIGKLPVYKSDSNISLETMPPDELETALNNFARAQNPQDYNEMNDNERASARVVAFLAMMRGEITIPIRERAIIVHQPLEEASRRVERIEPNTTDGLNLYIRNYLALSSVPNRRPEDIPTDAERVLGEKQAPPNKDSTITLPFELV